MKHLINKIVLVADVFEHNTENVKFNSTTLEKPSQEYVNDIYNALKKFVHNIHVCNSPKELNFYLTKNTADLVMTIYGGENSRNRMALVPAICESMNVKYLGADVYNRVLCQDKNLSKSFANKYNIMSPKSILIENENDFTLIHSLIFPLVIKPNYEGSSIGISTKSLVFNFNEARNLIKELRIIFKQPILVEEFIGGKEVNITVAGDNHYVDIFEVIEDINVVDDNFFDSNLYTLEHKQLNYENFTHRNITSKFDTETKNKIVTMYQHMGKIDFIRVDGKIFNNEFYLIELTPDPYCAIDSSFMKGMMANNTTYEDSLGILIQNCLKYYQTL